MGVVYRAWDPAVDRRVAIKPISAERTQEPGFRERFKGESRRAASIRHPNVITVFRAGEDDGHLFIAMDYVEGTDLEALIRSRAGSTPSWPRRSSPRSPTRWTPHMRRGWCTAMSSPPTS